jgi:CRISPR-associated protein Csx3
MQRFPAVLIGGPPDCGKSVLTYNLSQALRERGVQHYALRAAPDGEGDWSNEAQQRLVRTILAPREWTRDFVEHVCQSLARRHLPLLVDAGGRPQPWQEAIFDHCTHAIILTRNETDRATWRKRVERHNLRLLADLHSELHGDSEVAATSPHLAGTISGLERGQSSGGPTLAALVERLARLFDDDPVELRRSHLALAPVETPVDLDRLAGVFNMPHTGEKVTWQPGHLPRLLDYLPQGKPLGLYGRGPNWLYAAVALRVTPADFFQYDVRLGWVKPPQLQPGPLPTDSPLEFQQQPQDNAICLTCKIKGTHLDYDDTPGLSIPVPPAAQGLILSGQIPHWLLTALAVAYREAPLLAVFQPMVGQVVVHSRLPAAAVGDLLTG